VLNVGGASKTIPLPGHYAGWAHVLLDIAPGKDVDLVADARSLGEFPPSAFDAIYCSHNVEHYYPHEVPLILAGFRHVLKDDGFAEIRVPDLESVLRTMVERGLDLEDALYQSRSGPISVRDVLYGLGSAIAGGKIYFAHKTGFTQRSLRKALDAAGFAEVHELAPLGGYEIRVAAFQRAPSGAQLRSLGLGEAAARDGRLHA
jgi:SAM-dependent methyltransferase